VSSYRNLSVAGIVEACAGELNDRAQQGHSYVQRVEHLASGLNKREQQVAAEASAIDRESNADSRVVRLAVETRYRHREEQDAFDEQLATTEAEHEILREAIETETSLACKQNEQATVQVAVARLVSGRTVTVIEAAAASRQRLEDLLDGVEAVRDRLHGLARRQRGQGNSQ
jgi:vacuolar-type H+-ATPase subunit I/STV1